MAEEQPQPQQQMSEEQIKALQEKIKQMSPEELKEFQKKQCIFCQIITGKVQSKKIYEDEHVLAVLDINPANPGHVLVMPREHYSIMPQIPDEEIKHIFLVAKSLSNTTLRALEVQGSNIIVANGVAAGQRAQHFMVHVIPRKEKDGIEFQIPQKKNSEEDLEKISKLIAKSLGTKAEIAKKIPPVPVIPKENQIVEAEFKDKPIIKKPIKKLKTITTKKQKKEIKKSKEAKQQSADLDDIARILGAK